MNWKFAVDGDCRILKTTVYLKKHISEPDIFYVGIDSRKVDADLKNLC